MRDSDCRIARSGERDSIELSLRIRNGCAYMDYALEGVFGCPEEALFGPASTRAPLVHASDEAPFGDINSCSIQSITEVRLGCQPSSLRARSPRTRLFEPSPYEAIS